MNLNGKGIIGILSLLGLILCVHSGVLNAQSTSIIRGSVMDENYKPIGYSTIALFNPADSSLVAGTLSDSTGKFELTNYKLGDYFIRVSFIGYETVTIPIRIQTSESLFLGEIRLSEKSFELAESEVIGERSKARQQVDETTYYVNKQMQKASSTAIDLVKFIPGVQVDLFKNISLDGNSNIIIMIDGVERDAGFLQQVSAERIDKVEVINQPGAKYKGDISGVINVILKEEKNQGISGHIYTEVPLELNEVYAFPSYSFNYMKNNLNLYTSYDGEYSYFNIESLNRKTVFSENYESQITKVQELRQKNWSHKFHYGFDYRINQRNTLSFYGFVNPYSYEYDGSVEIHKIEQDSVITQWKADREDTDRNLSRLSSLYYKYDFSNPGGEISVVLNHYHLNGHHYSALLPIISGPILSTSIGSVQNLYTGKLDMVIPLDSTKKIETGVWESMTFLSDPECDGFNYTESVSAAYTTFNYDGNRFQLSSGLRVEYARNQLEGNFDKKTISILPYLSAKYDFSTLQNLKFAYRKSIVRPHMYQLNPNTSYPDPYSIHRGKAFLKPSLIQTLSLDYSITIKNNFISMGGFINRTDHAIENLTVVDDAMVFVNTAENLGELRQYGISLKGSIKPHKNILFNPSVKVYNIETRGNEIARNQHILNKKQMAMESGFSMAAMLKYDFTISSMFKYNSTIASIMGSRFEDILYFISVEKSFNDKFKIGITSAIPFKGEFTFRGFNTDGYQFNEYSEDNIQASLFPVWLKFTYNFSSGNKVNRINRSNDFKENKFKKGI